MADAKMKVSQMGAVLAMDDDDLINVVTYNDQSQTYVSGKATGAKVKEYMIGTGDISALGDGSVTGAILNVKSTSETADSNIAETMAQNGAHNLCPFPYEDGTSVYSGITITVNNDGTMTGSGTPNDSGAFFFYKGTLAKKSYKICFDGSFSGASIKLKVYDATAGQTLAELSSGNTVDYFTIDSTNATHTIWIYFNWNNEVEAVTISGGFVLLVATDPSTTYTPFAMTNGELTENISSPALVASASVPVTINGTSYGSVVFGKYSNGVKMLSYTSDNLPNDYSGVLCSIPSGFTLNHSLYFGGGSVSDRFRVFKFEHGTDLLKTYAQRDGDNGVYVTYYYV